MQTFNYPQFANAMTNYLLPWLALTAQLPYETGDPWANLIAFCLAVGSPALITYSLTLTILNRSWARKCFSGLRSRAARGSVSERAPHFDKKVSAIQFFVQESQQTPIRTNFERNWLASLIVLPENIIWWKDVQKRLKGTRRGFSPSLIAQMGLAVIAYGLTVVAALATNLGDPNTALQLASGCLWVWLIPVITGWVMAGSQVSGHAIYDALHQGNPAWRTKEHPRSVSVKAPNQLNAIGDDDARVETGEQSGIECGGGPDARLRSGFQGWCGFSVGGDEEITGPTYNYARLFTWWKVTAVLRDTISTALDNVSSGEVSHSLLLDSDGVATACGLDRGASAKHYLEWREMPAQVWRHVLSAAVAAIFVQWGTAGDSIMTAYMTPTTGLGCRSGSYLLYASASTLAWLLLVAGMLCSHEAMLRHQKSSNAPAHVSDGASEELGDRPELNELPYDNFGPGQSASEKPRSVARKSSPTSFRVAAVILRLLGKTLCILNTVWLLLTSIMELVGRFDNCWCQGVYPTRGAGGYVVLFKTAKDLAQTASVYWGAGLAMTIVVVLLAVFFFALGMWDPDTD
ncbi:hypothetical protein AMS68_007178 [Peltaster fructicola]|uniref:Uncharacterized protein n=1 Tax=Peltaster fructicola TaxID=286661 RepID=A0A6H0Y415_9PEZI|nr:hypothetical protein AMS68_007178 [Peltaster fructicola]